MPRIHVHSADATIENTLATHRIVEAAGFDARDCFIINVPTRDNATEYGPEYMNRLEQNFTARLHSALDTCQDRDVGSILVKFEPENRDGLEDGDFPEGTSDAFGASLVPYSPHEVQMGARLITAARLVLEERRKIMEVDVPIGFNMLAQPNRRYPAYDSHLDAVRCMGNANYYNMMTGVSAQFVDLVSTTCLDPHETYAWTVQALSWQRGMTNPDHEIVPVISCFPTGGGKGSGSRMHLQAQLQALHDMGYDEFVLWGVRMDPASMQQVMRDARMCYGMEAQEQEAPLFDAAADQQEQNARQDQEQAQLQQGFDETVSS